MSATPNPISIAWSILRARRVSRPMPSGTGAVDHSVFGSVLVRLSREGVGSFGSEDAELSSYRDATSTIDPDQLSRGEALAFWLNVYNAGAIGTAASAHDASADSVLRIPGAFSRPSLTVAGEALSLDDVEHGKIRRFGDPRIHGALVCGSISCPTLRATPFTGEDINSQLDDQMRSFIMLGGGQVDTTANIVTLSRVLKWYGRDFVSPAKMPTILPAGPKMIGDAVSEWFTDEDRLFISTTRPAIEFSSYDWGLGCAVARDTR
jgi:hypothetical protein